MSKGQTNTTLIFNYVANATKDFEPTLQRFEMRKPRISLEVFWTHLIDNLEIEEVTSREAAKLVWKLANKNVRLSNNLLYKLSTVCLMLAEKLYQDGNNTLQSFSLVSGVSKKDLKSLEVEILVLLDFNLNFSKEQLDSLPQWLIFQY